MATIQRWEPGSGEVVDSLEGCLQGVGGGGWEGANQAEEEGSMVYEKATVKRPFFCGGCR